MYGTNDAGVGWQATASLPSVTPINSNIDLILSNAHTAGLPVVRIQTTDIHETTNDDAGYSATYTDTGPTTLSSINNVSTNPSGRLNIENGINPMSPGIMSGRCAIWASDNAWHTITFTNFGFTNYIASSTVTNSTALSNSTITLGDTTGLNRSSGVISVTTTGGSTFLASYGGITGNNLTGVTYISGSGTIAATTSGYMGANIVTLVNYCVSSHSDVTTLSNSTLTLNSTVGLDPGGGALFIATDKLYEGVQINAVVTFTGVSGSTITGVTYVSGGVFFGNGNITGGNSSAVMLATPITGVSIAGASGGATISAGAPVHELGIPVPGGYMNMAITAWFAQYVDPIALRKY